MFIFLFSSSNCSILNFQLYFFSSSSFFSVSSWLIFVSHVCFFSPPANSLFFLSNCLTFISQINSFLASTCFFASNCTTFFSQLCSFLRNSSFSSCSSLILIPQLCSLWTVSSPNLFCRALYLVCQSLSSDGDSSVLNLASVSWFEIFSLRLQSCFHVVAAAMVQVLNHPCRH